LALAAGVVVAQESVDTTLHFQWNRSASAMPLPRDLCGLSIEADRFPDWAGNVTHRNEFTYTLMNNLREKTGLAPPIR
jgi:hypothetical protein